MTDGWISLHRKVKEHWLWKDPVKFQWWIDVLLSVNHADTKVNLGNKLFECKRGQSVKSYKTWGEGWRVSKDTAKNFFRLLETDKMVSLENLVKSTRLTVCNYDTYQVVLPACNTQGRRKADARQTQARTNNNVNKENKENKEVILEKSLSKSELFNQKVEQELAVLNPEDTETWQKYKEWFDSMEFESVIKIPKQLSPKQLCKLADQYNASLIKDKLKNMENRKKLDYKSVYLTLTNWLKDPLPV